MAKLQDLRITLPSDGKKPAKGMQHPVRKPRTRRTPEGIEKRKRVARERYRRLWKVDPKFRANEQERRKLRDLQDPERTKARHRARYHKNKKRENERKKRWSAKNREHLREYNRERYARNRAAEWEKIRAARIRRDPTYGLESACNQFRRGELSLDRFNKLIGERIAQINARPKQKYSRSRGRKQKL